MLMFILVLVVGVVTGQDTREDGLCGPGHQAPVLLLSTLTSSHKDMEVLILEVRRKRGWGQGVVTQVFLTPLLTRHVSPMSLR